MPARVMLEADDITGRIHRTEPCELDRGNLGFVKVCEGIGSDDLFHDVRHRLAVIRNGGEWSKCYFTVSADDLQAVI